MPDDLHNQEFAERLQRIEEERLRLRDAFREEHPARRPWQHVETGIKLASLTAIAVIGLKCALMYQLGPKTYYNQLAALAQGNQIERISAALMTPEPVTGALAVRLSEGTDQAVKIAGKTAAEGSLLALSEPPKDAAAWLAPGGPAGGPDSGVTFLSPRPAGEAPKPAGEGQPRFLMVPQKPAN